ncbi:MAG: hypothetical protein NC543_16440, partial [bacterium]|nr:hypothetical protein [bacterium]
KTACKMGRIIRLTASQAAGLLEDAPYTDEGDGIRCYQLTDGEFDTLLEALAEQGIEPEEISAGSDDLCGGLVYVKEAP